MSVLNDESGRPYKVHLCKTDISQNNNKFYDMELYKSAGGSHFTVKMINGRIGYRGVTHTKEFSSSEAARKFFDAKFREKTHLEWAERDAEPIFGKYVVVELATNSKKPVEPKKEEEPEPVEHATEPEPVKTRGRSRKAKREVKTEPEPEHEGYSFVDEQVKDLMKCICDEDVHLGLLKQLKFNEEHGKPIDCLSLAQLETGYEILAAIEKSIGGRRAARSSTRNRSAIAPSSSGASMHDTNKYYSLIPHSFGFQVPPKIDTLAKVQSERELLDALKGSIEAAQSVQDLKKQASKKDIYHRLYERLPCQLEPVSAEIGEKIGECLKLRGPTHAYKCSYVNAFELKVQEQDQLAEPPKPSKRARRGAAAAAEAVAEKRLLWHGTRVTNVFSILMNGLNIPEGDRYGLMFGNGVYFANMPTKSANYCSWEASRRVFMLLCEVDVSNPLILYESEVDAVEKIVKEKKASVYAAGKNRPTETIDINGTLAFKSGLIEIDEPTDLLYDEYVMFDTQKWKIKYVVEVNVERARI